MTSQHPRVRVLASPRLPDALLGAVVVVSTGFYLLLARSLWFSADDWAFLLRRGTVSGDVPGADLGLWQPHNEHWSTGPILIYRGLFAMFGLRHSLPYLVPVLIAHAAVVILTYLLLVRFGVRRWVGFGVAALLAFNGAGAENTLWAFQIGFVGPVALGLLALWLWDHHDVARWPVWPTWAVLVVGLTFSSIGVVMVACVTAYALLRRGVRAALLAGCVPAAVYVVWFAAAGRHSLDTTPHLGLSATVANLPVYVWTVLAHSWEMVAGLSGAGAVMLVVSAGAVVLPASDRARRFAWAGLFTAVLLAALIGVGRAAYGLEHSKASRYVYVLVALMAPLLAVLLDAVADRVRRPRWLAAAAGVILLGLVVVHGAGLAVGQRDQRLALFGTLRERTLAAASLLRDGATMLNSHLEEQENPDLTMELLGSREIQEQLPELTAAPQARLDAAAILQVRVTGQQLDLPGGSVQLDEGFREQADPAPGCHEYTATTPWATIRVVAGAAGGRVRITGDSTRVYTQLQRGWLRSEYTSWPTGAGLPYDIGSAAGDADLLVTLDRAGVVQVCG